jgi:hypothetical protein
MATLPICHCVRHTSACCPRTQSPTGHCRHVLAALSAAACHKEHAPCTQHDSTSNGRVTHIALQPLRLLRAHGPLVRHAVPDTGHSHPLSCCPRSVPAAPHSIHLHHHTRPMLIFSRYSVLTPDSRGSATRPVRAISRMPAGGRRRAQARGQARSMAHRRPQTPSAGGLAGRNGSILHAHSTGW